MDKVEMIFAGISTVEKLAPVIEGIAKEIGPIVQTELKDGKLIWVDVLQAWNDFKAAVAHVKASVQTPAQAISAPPK